MSRFEKAAASIPGDKTVIFYCQSGMRSKNALRRAKKMGLNAEGHLGGGLSNWRRCDYPIAR
jgi:rhodanese-related sulfurtransferase